MKVFVLFVFLVAFLATFSDASGNCEVIETVLLPVTVIVTFTSTETTTETQTTTTSTITSTTTSTATTTATSASSSATGIVYFHSQPVNPNETVLVTGGPWALKDNLSIQMVQVPNSAPQFPFTSNMSLLDNLPATICQVLAQTTHSISFIVPSFYTSGVYAYRIVLNKTIFFTKWNVINTPELWFVQGNMIETASSGGWIGAYGTSLQVYSSSSIHKPTLVLVDYKSNNSYSLSSSLVKTLNNRWAQYFDIPNSIPPSYYNIFLHNGNGGDFGWTFLSNFNPVALNTTTGITVEKGLPAGYNLSYIVDVTTMVGANWDAKFNTAMNLVKKFGGVVYVPPGTYTLTTAIQMSAFAVLRGAGRDLTTLVWQSNTYWFRSLVVGAVFGIEKLTLRASMQDNKTNPICGIKAITRGQHMAGASGFGVTDPHFKKYTWIDQVTITGPLPNETIVCEAPNWLFSNGILTWNSANTMITNVSIDSSNNAISHTHAAGNGPNYTHISNVTVKFYGLSVGYSCGSNHVAEGINRQLLGNHILGNYPNCGQPGYLIGSYCSDTNKDYYYGESESSNKLKTYNDNTLSEVSISGSYLGGASANGTLLTLNHVLQQQFINFTNHHRQAYTYDNSTVPGIVGKIIVIISGTGMGQYRYVVNIGPFSPTNPTVVVDRPWDVEPDNSSLLRIEYTKGRILIVNNRFFSEGIHQVQQGASHDVIYADNSVGAVGVQDWYDCCWQSRGQKPDIPTAIVSGIAYSAGSSSFPGFCDGPWYHQFVNNTVNFESTGISYTQGVSYSPPPTILAWTTSSGVNLSFNGVTGFGIIVRNNKNPYGYAWHLNLQSFYVGSFLVENNAKMSGITYSPTQEGSVGIFRGNTDLSEVLLSQYKCQVSIQKVYDCILSNITSNLYCPKRCNDSLTLFM